MERFELERLRQTLTILQETARRPLRPLEGRFRPGKPDFTREDELRPFGRDETWGGRDCDGWFRFELEIPPEWEGLLLRLEVETGREGLWNAVNPQFLVYLNGREAGALDTNHRWLRLGEPAHAGERFTVDLDAWSGMVTRKTAAAYGSGNEPIWTRATVCAADAETERLFWDMKAPYGVAEQLPAEDYRRIRILQYLTGAANRLDLREPGNGAYSASVREAAEYLRREFYEGYCGDSEGEADCVGHTHIDVAWQWTYAHTRRKAARSFATVLRLLAEYPEYRFMSSQPQLYEFVKEDHPALYARIREQVRSGAWEAEGGMWVEADCNLSSGESLVRQFLYGKRFFQEEFGTDSRILWLPDVFGYSAALPQICKKCGVDYFMTTKLSWNDTNKFPYDTFWWKGIDGTELLTHFVSTRDYVGHPVGDQPKAERVTAYNGVLEPRQVQGGWERYQQKELNPYYLFSYGYGDGGGGTTPEMLENARRLEKGIPGCPKVRHSTALDFFGRLEADVRENPRLPRWYGELYLEFHRGTYTSIAKNKRNNRRAEFALEAAEALTVLEQTLAPETAGDSRAALADCWKKTLLNQFHDVLPGSSIRAVYEDTDQIYAGLFAQLCYLSDGIRSRLAARVARPGDSLVVWNLLGFRRDGYVRAEWPAAYPEFHLETADGDGLAVQRTFDGKALFYAPDVPGMGYASYSIHPGAAPGRPLTADRNGAENAFLRIRFDGDGRLCSVYDREAERELLPAGEYANRLETYEDRPHCYDAWEIEAYHKEKCWPLDAPESFALVECGPHRAVYRARYRYLESSIEQLVILYARSRRIDFVTTADWHQQHILLKAAFPTDILAAAASYEVQFGAVERPTHTNTSWDAARFESCAQKWADLSEDGYGAALLNDCKYGYDIHEGVLRLSLLKCATFPNEAADQGRHEFTYSLMPHRGGWREAGVSREAYDLNAPLAAQLAPGAAAGLPPRCSWLECEAPNVNGEVLKPAEDGAGVVVRLYEAFGRRTACALRVAPQVQAAWECDMLERPLEPLRLRGSRMELCFRPFEIKTLRLAADPPAGTD